MNPQVFKKRREVISLIHAAKRLFPQLPRIDVRVTENDETILGVATMGKRKIWITEKSTVSRAVVFHEILHAVFSQKHVASCPLMAPAIDSKLPDDVCNEMFLKYVTLNSKAFSKRGSQT